MTESLQMASQWVRQDPTHHVLDQEWTNLVSDKQAVGVSCEFQKSLIAELAHLPLWKKTSVLIPVCRLNTILLVLIESDEQNEI